MARKKRQKSLLSLAGIGEAVKQAIRRLSPRHQMRNPVMFTVSCASILTTLVYVREKMSLASTTAGFAGAIAFWLWFTVLFANFAESFAEGRGKAQAATLRQARQDVPAKRLKNPDDRDAFDRVEASALREGDIVAVTANDIIPGDGQVIEGIASVDESAITGESAPVIRESGGDRDAVTGGTRVLSDWLIVRITANPGESFLDKMIGMVEGAKRQKTPNEIALSILLAAMTIVFLLVTATLLPFSLFAVTRTGAGEVVGLATLTALLVCLAPTTIGGLLSAIGIAGMNRLIRANVIATSGRAVEAAGDVNVLLLDKTGTITYGNRQAFAFQPLSDVKLADLAQAAVLSSLADDTPEGKSILALAHNKYQDMTASMPPQEATFIPFSAETRVSGVKIGATEILKGAGDAIKARARQTSPAALAEADRLIEAIARQGGTPLLVARNERILGVLHLKDIIKTGIKNRLADLRRMGIKSIMVTGDNPLTASAIASEAGVDDFIAEATPETKLKYIRKRQEGGELVAMVGDGTNDAPALAQADVAVAMNSGTQAAKEAGNMIDLDSDPTKLIEIVEIGKQLLMTRGSLTTFSLANDIAKYFAIIPSVFVATYPALGVLNVMHLASPESAILSAVIFNALIIPALIPLAMRGVKYRPLGATGLLRYNLAVYGGGGVILPFVGIKLIDLLLHAVGVC
jgi:K+-transporting ATPase ATPase B chain